MNIIKLNTYISHNGTKVVKELLHDQIIRKTVYLPKTSSLKKAGVDGFVRCNVDDQISAFGRKGRPLAYGHEDVKNLIYAIKNFGLKA